MQTRGRVALWSLRGLWLRALYPAEEMSPLSGLMVGDDGWPRDAALIPILLALPLSVAIGSLGSTPARRWPRLSWGWLCLRRRTLP
jgi:hypothetical protein